MKQQNAAGSLHDADAETRRQAARAMGQARTEKKINAARAVAESRKGCQWTEEQKANLRARRAEIRQEKRERERAERIAAGLPADAPPPEPKKMGRPRLHPVAEASTRGRGRPKKQDAQILVEADTSAENGAGDAGEA